MRRTEMSQSEIITACALVVAACLVIVAAVVVVDRLGGPTVPWASKSTRSIDEPQEAAARTDSPQAPVSEEAPSAEAAANDVVEPGAPTTSAVRDDPELVPAFDAAGLLGDLILPAPFVGRISVPRATIPPSTLPPVVVPPVTRPPTTQPPTTEPPVTEPPVTEPPVTEPPVTEPPVTDPPVTDPVPPDPPSSPGRVIGEIHDLIDQLIS